MAIDVRNDRLFDTVSESAFGPQCGSDTEAAALAHHVWRVHGLDARAASDELLGQALDELRRGMALTMETHSHVACFCGSGKPWLSRTEQVGKPTVTICDNCLGTAQQPEPRRGFGDSEPPTSKIIDLFDALKRSLA